MNVPVREEYTVHVPQWAWKPYVEDLLRVVPSHYLRGLGFVLLTDSQGKSRAERRAKLRSRRRKVLLHKCLGYYAHASADGPAYIVLHVDQIDAYEKANQKPFRRHGLRYNLAGIFFAPAGRRWRFARVLFHEIGHHIHETQRPEFRERENVADAYSFRLMRRLTIRRWYLCAVAITAMVCLYPREFWGMVRKHVGRH